LPDFDLIQLAAIIGSSEVSTPSSLPGKESAVVVNDHIVHATAVFSELAIGIAVTLLYDPLNWKRRNNRAMRIRPTDQKTMTVFINNLDDLPIYYRIPNQILVKFERLFKNQNWIRVKYYLPVLGILSACSALFSMAGQWPLNRTDTYTFGVAAGSFLWSLVLSWWFAHKSESTQIYKIIKKIWNKMGQKRTRQPPPASPAEIDPVS
jgi:hypothetical protein